MVVGKNQAWFGVSSSDSFQTEITVAMSEYFPARQFPNYYSVKITEDGALLYLSLFVFIGVLDAHLSSSNQKKHNGYVNTFQNITARQDHYHVSDIREKDRDGEMEGMELHIMPFPDSLG